ncbi:MAG: hypothetical protein AMXMBFR84_22150 [Candidatus Hydrogenedentota bacterium]
MDIKLTVRSSPNLLCSIRGLVRSYLSNFGIDSDRVDDAVLAVDEACANAIRHSYEGKADQEYELTFSSNGEFVDIALKDEGIPAPLDRIERRELTTPSRDTLKPGGLGVQLMYYVFDEVRFVPGEAHGNTVIMRLRRRAL